MIWRSTTLNQISRHCAGVMNHTDPDRSKYEHGIAAHDVLHQVGLITNATGRALSESAVTEVADATCASLIEKGRSFEGVPEPPLNPDRVFIGRDIAVEYLWREPIEPGARFEIKLSADAGWIACRNSNRAARWTGIADVIRRADEPGEEWTEDVLTIRDYKSGWSTGPAWLESIQAKMYACLAYADAAARSEVGMPDVIRLEVVNLRTAKAYSRDLRLPGATVELERFQRDLDITANALESQAGADQVGSDESPAPFKYSPGAGCIGCPVIDVCPEVAGSIAMIEPDDNAELRAETYVLTKSLADYLAPLVKKDADEQPVPLPDGGSVGFFPKDTRTPANDVLLAIADRWSEQHGTLRGFVAATGLGVAQIDRLAKRMFPDDFDARRAWIGTVITTERRARFGIQKAKS